MKYEKSDFGKMNLTEIMFIKEDPLTSGKIVMDTNLINKSNLHCRI